MNHDDEKPRKRWYNSLRLIDVVVIVFGIWFVWFFVFGPARHWADNLRPREISQPIDPQKST